MTEKDLIIQKLRRLAAQDIVISAKRRNPCYVCKHQPCCTKACDGCKSVDLCICVNCVHHSRFEWRFA